MARLRYPTAALCVAAAVLAGCGGSQPLIGNLGAAPQGRAITQQAAHSKSWMLPEAKRDDLLYATNNAGFVHVFSYPAGKEVGTIVVAGDPMGACVDRAGNVWITRFRMASAVEFAHGGTSSIGSVSTSPNTTPWGCAVDPTTGNLAVTTSENIIDVYANAQGNPMAYTVQGDGYGFTFCTYDDSGNLFATAPYSNIAELPKGSSEMTNMQLDFSINPWSIQWDERDKYLAVAGYKAQGQPTPIYHVSVSGMTRTLVGKTLLKGPKVYPPQYWIEGSTILGPGVADSLYGTVQNRIESWPYPAGGRPRQFAHVAKDGHPGLYGFVVSRAR